MISSHHLLKSYTRRGEPGPPGPAGFLEPFNGEEFTYQGRNMGSGPRNCPLGPRQGFFAHLDEESSSGRGGEAAVEFAGSTERPALISVIPQAAPVSGEGDTHTHL